MFNMALESITLGRQVLILAGAVLVAALPATISAIFGVRNHNKIEVLTVSINGRIGDLIEALKGRISRAEGQLDNNRGEAALRAEHSTVTTVTSPTAEPRQGDHHVGSEHVVVAPVTVVLPEVK